MQYNIIRPNPVNITHIVEDISIADFFTKEHKGSTHYLKLHDTLLSPTLVVT